MSNRFDEMPREELPSCEKAGVSQRRIPKIPFPPRIGGQYSLYWHYFRAEVRPFEYVPGKSMLSESDDGQTRWKELKACAASE